MEVVKVQKSISIKEKSKPAVETDKMFDIMFVCNENESVEVIESPIIDFGQVIEQLRKGNSIFIAPKHCGQAVNQKRPKRQDNHFINHI
jgi:hypothetical protein